MRRCETAATYAAGERARDVASRERPREPLRDRVGVRGSSSALSRRASSSKSLTVCGRNGRNGRNVEIAGADRAGALLKLLRLLLLLPPPPPPLLLLLLLLLLPLPPLLSGAPDWQGRPASHCQSRRGWRRHHSSSCATAAPPGRGGHHWRCGLA